LLNPFLNIRRTIFELYTTLLTASQKFHGALVDERHFLQIQKQLVRLGLFGKNLLQSFDILGFNSASEGEYGLGIRGSLNFEHPSFPVGLSRDSAKLWPMHFTEGERLAEIQLAMFRQLSGF
jgi:hypothetical protein